MRVKMTERLVELDHVTKTYLLGGNEVSALCDVSLTIDAGDYVAIVGASGSGKSTLMHILGLLDRPTHGVYSLRGTDTPTVSMPVTWDEVERTATTAAPLRFELTEALERVEAEGDLLEALHSEAHSLPSRS